ncbi:hypothetical protein OG410_18695 [Streptomyces sp. NBC_00659]|uniref:hypothetical protein n=1 Tax=Streptomyces sp. NBC_00659 TaxID=2903669 RepID=UPI002E2EE773|nr:hypothetical protein [Streptomyces sp. NBC_00659]
MARSTIQEKLSGNSTLTLSQVLSLVEALAEHAMDNDMPLPSQEISRDVWRDRVSASFKTESEASTRSPEKESGNFSGIDWDTKPLEQAEMADLVNLIRGAQRRPVSTWLPRLLQEVMEAGMEIDHFLKQAAEDSIPGVIQTLKELEDEFPYLAATDNPWGGDDRNPDNLKTVDSLLQFTVERHGLAASPAVIVGLRRSGLTHHVERYLELTGTYFHPENILSISEHLISAILTKDSMQLFHSIGKHRPVQRIPQVLQVLRGAGKILAAKKLLQSIGDTNTWRIERTIEELENSGAPDEVLRDLALGIPHEKHDDYIAHFSTSRHENFSKMILDVRDNHPLF